MALGAMSPSNVRKLVRIALEVGGAVGSQAVDALIDSGATIDTTVQWPIRKVQIVWRRTSAGGVDEDVAVVSLHFINITSGAVDETWTTTDFTTLEALIDTWWGSLKSGYGSNTILSEYRWYHVRPGSLSGDSVRLTSRTVAGTGTSSLSLPPQCAISVTQKTQLRKRWGRIYLPAPINTKAVDGMVLGTWATTCATATQTLFDGARAADFEPVVYSPTAARAFPVLQVQVDDLYDVIRSRRYGRATTKVLLPAS